MGAKIAAIASYLPDRVETNDDLALLFPEWSAVKIGEKTGIYQRHISAPDEFSSHIATRAAERLFSETDIDRESIDALILVTQSPDYLLPTTACIVHANLGLRETTGSFDLSLGCSGYVFGLSQAQAMIESRMADRVLLVTADTYTKFLNSEDKTVRTIFGDGGTATLIEWADDFVGIEGFSAGTNGASGSALMVPNGMLRPGSSLNDKANPVERGLVPSSFDLYMDGPAIFNFTLDVVGPTIERVLAKAHLEPTQIDAFVFHQANKFMLSHLVSKLEIPSERAPIVMGNWGNTVSSTIPMALEELRVSGQIHEGMSVMLVGFGVGLSWAGVLVRF